MKAKRIFTVVLAAVFVISFVAVSAAADVNTYRDVAKQSVRQILQGSLSSGDVDALMTDQGKLVEIGINMSREHLKMHPADTKLLNLAINNAESMKNMTVMEIMKKWHQGEFLKANGIDFDSLDHFSPGVTIMYTIVHPATAYAALQEYKTSQDAAKLATVKDQLALVLEHMDYLAEHLENMHMHAQK